MVVTIHQPEHLPWLGFFAKAAMADVLVLLDDVPYRKNYFQNRNRVRTAVGYSWLTVPVLHRGHLTPLREVAIANESNPRWSRKHWLTLQQSYGGAPHFSAHESFFRTYYAQRWSRLAEANRVLIDYLLSAFEVPARVMCSSALDHTGLGRTERLLSICRTLGAETYLSGVSGRDYLDVDAFSRAGIAVEFQRFRHPVYEQRYQPFLPCMSAVDLLFNEGPRARDILRGIDTATLDIEFD
jgi:hypothetical protein